MHSISEHDPNSEMQSTTVATQIFKFLLVILSRLSLNIDRGFVASRQ